MTYVLSDIHGNLKNFQSILGQIDLQPDDTLYILGDVIDRHPHGIALLLQITDMSNVHMLLGNHEFMMMRALGFPYDGEEDVEPDLTFEQKISHWYRNGGSVTHQAWDALDLNDKRKLVQYLKGLPLNARVSVGGRNFLLCHACPTLLYEKLVLDGVARLIPGMATYFSVWQRDCIHLMEEFDAFTTIYGHTPTSYFQPGNPLRVFKGKNILGIDCGSGFLKSKFSSEMTGRLACIRLDDMTEFYSDS